MEHAHVASYFWPIASSSSSKRLAAKPDGVNDFDLVGKVAANYADAKLRA